MKSLIINLCNWILWKLSNDAIYSGDTLDEIYNDVPENIAKSFVRIYTYHVFGENVSEINRWMDDEY